MMRRKNNRFTIMIAGPQGSGRSALFNNLLGKPIVNTRSTSEIDIYVIGREEDRPTKQITYIETPGFGVISNEEAIYDSIIEYIREQLDSYIEEESKIRRNPHYEDTRVQCLLYTIPATGNGLKQRDIAFLKKATSLVNIMPVITKGDALSSNELRRLKQLVTDQMQFYGINIFGTTGDVLEEESFPRDAIPFAVICTDDPIDQDRCREHVAGPIAVEDPANSDLQALKSVLLRTHTEALIEATAIDIYENYRAEALEAVMDQ